MAAKSSDWQPGPTVCRCCLTEGCYKDISTEYFWMGKREVYSEMLSETFDVTISYALSMGTNSNSRLICEPCISRLRDASDFKRQVLDCERTFLQYLVPQSSSAGEGTTATDQDIKVSSVKLEVKFSDDEEIDTSAPFQDDDDDLDDEPLTKLASKIPKKESVDYMELEDNAKPVKRKSTIKIKASPSKKAKKTKETVKATASKAAATAKPEKKKKAECNDPSRANAEIIIRCTTAFPFRVNDKCMLCVYCQELFEDPTTFRQHMDHEHATFRLNIAFHSLPKSEFVKADITDLRCRLCPGKFNDLDAIAKHLHDSHDQRVNFGGKLGVMPYVLRNGLYNCAVCAKNFPSLFHLNRHTITHFLTYVCHVCGSSYVATTGLLRHVRSKHQEYQVQCKRCMKTFPTMEAKERHRRVEKSCMPYCCPKCSERFLDWKARKRHLETAHGHEKKVLRCPDCDINFAVESAYYEHFRLQHSDDCASCKHCGLKFLSLSRLNRHLKRHSL